MDIEQRNIDFATIIASAVHDMKNSLSMLLNYLDDVVDYFKEIDVPEAVQLTHLHYEAKRVNNNLIQLLSLYRLDKSMYSLNITYNSINELFNDLVIQNKTMLDYKNISVETECEDDLFWFFDLDMISGVLNSTMNNSFRYTKSKLRLVAEVEDGYLKISIEDDGGGYPKNLIDATSNHREKSIDFTSGSTGLGLFFAEIVADYHTNKDKRGYINLCNTCSLGGGCFSLYLP
ncbi:MAG: HAMP domain-containing histidine kinase [Nitrospirae bacterium]|nr:HAMP domain-containing histidine kinase [Nitrospirota bacterium]